MSANQGKLYLFGGLQEDPKNEPKGELIIANPVTSTIERITPPEFLSGKTKVFGLSSVWLEDDTLLLLGESTPPLGYGGRSLLLYSHPAFQAQESNSKRLEPCYY